MSERDAVARLARVLYEADGYTGQWPDVPKKLHECFGRAELDALRAALTTKAAEREAAALAMREAAAKACESRASSLMQQTRDGVMRVSESNEASKCASAIRCLPTPTSALDAERERVVRWCWQEWAGGMRYDFDAESEIARALAAAKGGQDA